MKANTNFPELAWHFDTLCYVPGSECVLVNDKTFLHNRTKREFGRFYTPEPVRRSILERRMLARPSREEPAMRNVIGIVLALVAASAAGAESDDAKLPVIEYAQSPPMQIEWPGAANREAYVILGFDVLANGRVVNIHPVDDGFHEKRFVDAATRALRNSKWKPRRINGQAVDSPGMVRAFNYSLPIERGITKEFQTEARKVEDLLKKGDYAGGEFHAQWMLSEKVKLNYEYAILQAELGQTYAMLGRTEDAVRKLRRATSRSGARMEFLQLLDSPPPNKASNYLLEKELVMPLLEMRMRLLASQGLALEAMQSYYEMLGLGELPPGHPATDLAARLTAEIRGGGNLRGRVSFSQSGWRQYLSRRSFTLENVAGAVKSMSLTCAKNSRNLDYRSGVVWTVPEGWGLCAVIIEAEPGATLEFVEFPDAVATVSGAASWTASPGE